MKLNVKSYNDLIFKAMKDQSPTTKVNFLKDELKMSSGVLFEQMCVLCDELVENNYTSEQFIKVQNVKSNLCYLAQEIKRIEKEFLNEQTD